ncbi:hypothetical protein ACFQX6_15280 [Streptosporangium lutulentum]
MASDFAIAHDVSGRTSPRTQLEGTAYHLRRVERLGERHTITSLRLAQHEPLGPDRGGYGVSDVSPADSYRSLRHLALRRSCRLVPDQHGVSSTTVFQVRAGSFTASHPS